ncbi:MAG TPA: hypothetical protein VK587_08520 [bacterium]|nr:hypothetical protein [bacterium]
MPLARLRRAPCSLAERGRLDELIRATGLDKATMYRLYSSKGELIGAYLQRLSASILAA